MCRGSPVALNHEALNIRVNDPFSPVSFEGNWSLSHFRFFGIALD